MTRENTYKIEILFEIDNQTRSLYIGNVQYYGSISFTDDFQIYNTKIIIEAKRSAIIRLDDIFYNHFSSLYNQVLKSLLFYYASTRKFTKIISVKVSRIRSSKILESKTFIENQFKQVLDNAFKINYQFDQNRLQELFLETPKGQSTLIAISYILTSNTNLSESDKFEKLWKAFNKLFTQITGEKKDFDCLRKLSL